MEYYYEIGKLLESIQLWEEEFKKITKLAHIEKSDDKRSLSNMNSFLLRQKVINENEYQIIKEVIEIRNIIIHRLFLDDYQKELIINRANCALDISNKLFKKINDLLNLI